MNIKTLVLRTLQKLREFWNYKIFRIAILLHCFYFILSVVLFFVFLNETNDFIIFYESGNLFISDVKHLYDQTYYLWDFRYLPLSALFFVPFSFFPFSLAYILFNFLNLFLNIIIILLIYKIVKIVRGEDHEKEDDRVILYISIYLMCVPHVLNYIYGQINLFITLFILISLFLFLVYDSFIWEFVSSFILGISIIIKPTSIFLIPFLLMININLKKRKIQFKFLKSVVRLFGVILPVSLNFILFFIYPEMWEGFLATNFTGSNALALNFSFSLTKLITNLFYFFNIPFNQLSVLLVIILIVGGIGFTAYVIRNKDSNSILYGYTIGIIIMLLVYYDSWDHHLLNLIPLMIIIIFNLPRKSKFIDYIKPSLFFFSFFDLLFVGIWFFTYPIFPYNFIPTFFLLISLIGISIYLIRGD